MEQQRISGSPGPHFPPDADRTPFERATPALVPRLLVLPAPTATSSAAPSRTAGALPVPFASDWGALPLNHATRAAMAAMHRGSSRAGWDDEDGDAPPTYRFETSDKRGSVSIIAHQDSTRPRGILDDAPDRWELVRALDDDTSDVLIACLLQWWQYSGRPEQAVRISVDAILDARGIERVRRRGEPGTWQHGHRPMDRRKVGRAFERLHNLRVRLDNVVLGGKNRFATIPETPLLVMEKREVFDDDGHPCYFAAEVRPGEWVRPYIEQRGRQFGWLPRQALRYDPLRQRTEKRLAKYLAYIFRAEARRGAATKGLHISTLLDNADLTEEAHNPQRTRDRLHAALATLQRDDIVASWAYADPGAAAGLPARHWFGQWRKLTVELGIPQELRDRYRALSGKSDAA
jgi:hypothetical protein